MCLCCVAAAGATLTVASLEIRKHKDTTVNPPARLPSSAEDVQDVGLVLQHVHHPHVRLHGDGRYPAHSSGLQTKTDNRGLVGVDQQIL